MEGSLYLVHDTRPVDKGIVLGGDAIEPVLVRVVSQSKIDSVVVAF